MNKTVGLDIVKLNLFFMKSNNLTSLTWVSSQLTDHFEF